MHRSVADLEVAIRKFIDAHNEAARPYIGTKSADDILASLSRFAQRTLDVQEAQEYIARITVTGH